MDVFPLRFPVEFAITLELTNYSADQFIVQVDEVHMPFMVPILRSAPSQQQGSGSECLSA